MGQLFYLYRVVQEEWEHLVKCNVIILQHVSNCCLNSLNSLLIYLLSYSDYMKSLFCQFCEIDNLQHIKVWSFRCSTKTANGIACKAVITHQLLKRFQNEISERSIWFAIENAFTAATPFNSQNESAYSVERKIKQAPKRRHYIRTELYLTQPEIRSTFFFRRMLPSSS